MSENKSIKILMDDESCEENQKSAKDLEDEKRAEKEAQQKLVSVINYQRKHYTNQVWLLQSTINTFDPHPSPHPKKFSRDGAVYEKFPFFTDFLVHL